MSKSYVNLENKYDRVIVLVDMDCFYCQVEEKLNPELKNKPIAVVQYNEWRGGGIIAVNYAARAAGVTRHMRGDEAKEHCPDIILCKVPNVRGKADLSKYRDAGKEVAQVLGTFSPLLERASVDEAYLDITESVHAKLREMNTGTFKLDASKFGATHAVGYDNIGTFVQELTSRCGGNFEDEPIFENETEYERNALKRSDLKLLIGAAIVNDIRATVKEKTGYECSAGIFHNKILAKLTAGMHKPNQQTLLPVRKVPELYSTLPVGKVKGLGGKFGEQVCETLKVKLMSELRAIPKDTLLQKFDEKNGNWLYLISRGVDLEHVQCRYNAKSIACCKRFPGKSAIIGVASLNHWLLELATEICERMEKDALENNRKAKQMIISFTQTIGSEDISSSRSGPLQYYEPELLAKDALEVIKRNTTQFTKPENAGTLNNHIKFLGISVSKFEDQTKSGTLKEMFKKQIEKAEETASNSSETSLNEIMARKKKSFSTELDEKAGPSSAAPLKKSNSLLESMFKRQQQRLSTEERKEESTPIETKDDIDEAGPSTSSKTVAELKKSNSSLKNMFKNHQTTEESVKIDVKDEDSRSFDETSMDSNNEPSHFSDNEDQKSVDYEYHDENSENNVTNNESNKSDEDIFLPESDEEDINLPEIEPVFIQCEICKRKILEEEMSAHKDYHFALQLSHQERQKFREEQKAKFSPQPVKSVANSSNAKKKAISKNTLKPIDNFFKKAEDEEEIAKNGIKCDECGKFVMDIIEHMDYHFAKKLQQQERQEIAGNSMLTPTNSSNSKKRKREDSRSDKADIRKCKPLTAFFSKND
ncbi:DNA polymerase eta [Culicoides brevitarsis]|uniref:DNA polymerase eta n=1 Tax=Culicoides brevitarsis TaxID=469753 RepID=UPI00307C6D6C